MKRRRISGNTLTPVGSFHYTSFDLFGFKFESFYKDQATKKLLWKGGEPE